MTRQIVLRSPPSLVDRRQPLLITTKTTTTTRECGGGNRVAEVVGGTTAECAAVCCCCPCGLANLLVLAVYKVPAGLCRKALRGKRRRKMAKQGFLQQSNKCNCSEFDLVQIHPFSSEFGSPINEAAEMVVDQEAVELEKEMWDRFYGAGFWRSPSQRTNL